MYGFPELNGNYTIAVFTPRAFYALHLVESRCESREINSLLIPTSNEENYIYLGGILCEGVHAREFHRPLYKTFSNYKYKLLKKAC